MAIFKKVKDWLGIEGVKVALAIDETFKLKENVVRGSYSISSQSDQYIESVRLIFKEKYSRGRRKGKLIDEYVLSQSSIEIEESIKEDQVITREFELAFEPLKSGIEKWGDKNILYKGLTSVVKVFKNAKSSYSITVEVSVKGNKLKPYDTATLVAD